MRRILFLLTLICVAAMATEIFAQQCCSRRPLLGRGISTQSCFSQVATTTQTMGAVNAIPVNQTPICSTGFPTTASTCCSPTCYGQPISSGNVVAAVQASPFSGIPNPAISEVPNQGSLGSCVSELSGAFSTTPVPVQTQTVFASNPAPLYSPSIGFANTTAQPAVVQSSPIISSNLPTVQPAVSTNFARPSYVMPTFTQTSMQLTQQYASGGLAQRKAQRAAQMGLRGHLGGSLGGARYEGVGWSSLSPQNAIQNCCYWGQRPASQIGVARGNDGSWYACVLYR